jgi:hypothetical protein
VSPRVAVGLLLPVICTLRLTTAAAATPFAIQKVDSLGDRGIHNSLALDSRQVPHISYYGDGQILYASRVDTTWTIELVDSVGDVGYYTSLALDANDAPHISYFDLANADIRYATKAPGYWVNEVVDSVGSVGQWGSLALDGNGNPGITYFDNTNGDLKYAKRANGVWTIEIVDSAGVVGFYTSLAIDALGQACVSYLDLEGALKFARRTSTGWTPETVESGVNVGAYSSLALDPSGYAHISYADLGFETLKYAREISSGWMTETVDATDFPGHFTSIQLAGGTSPRISYVARETNQLLYAARAAFGWSIEIIDSLTPVDFFTSLKLDPEGNPKISYYDTRRTTLKFVDSSVRIIEPRGGELWAAGTSKKVIWAGIGPVDVYLSQDGGATYTKVTSSPTTNHTVDIMVPAWSTGTARAKVVRASPLSSSASPGVFLIAPGLASPWWTKLVDAAGFTGFTPSLTLTQTGSPRISYWDTSTGAVRYAARVGGLWTVETVRAGLGSHTLSPLTINPYGVPTVAYFNNLNRTLNCAFRLNGAWTSEVVRSFTVAGEYCSLALDGTGSPRIAYYESAPGRLVLAARFGTSWATEDVDQGVDVGIMNSLALDSLGYPYISHYDAPAGNLKFAYKSGPAWVVETVDHVGDVGANSSLTLDPAGNPHISYVDVSNGFLKYATKGPGGWRIETVDYGGEVDGTTSIALAYNGPEALGSPRIAYHDPIHHALKYATRVDGAWRVETVAPAVGGNRASSLALDSDGNARVAYLDERTYDLRYASAAVELGDPTPGARWPVGAHKTARWEGVGSVDISISQDAGATWNLVAPAVAGGSYNLLVPALPSTQCKLRIQRALPYSSSVSDTFTILAGVDLLSFRADPVPFGAGADVTWETDPTVPDLAGYRLERALDGITYATVLPLTIEKSYRDPASVAGTKYRLTAINGSGGEIALGETEFRPRKPLAAGPLPYRGGSLAISFAAVGAAGSQARAEVRLYDLRGRLVRTIARGDYAAGFQSAEWNGTDDRGRTIASGIYFLKSTSGGHEAAIKITVLR